MNPLMLRASAAEAVKLAASPNPYLYESQAPLQLDVNPRDLGIHSRRTGEDYRGIAYTHGIPAVALAGGMSAATFKGFTGHTPLEAAKRSAQWVVENQGRTLGEMTSSAGERLGISPAYRDAMAQVQNRAEAIRSNVDAAKATSARDVATAVGDSARRGVAKAREVASSAGAIADDVSAVVRRIPAPVQEAARNAVQSASSVLPADIAAKRLRAAGKAGLVGGALFGTGKGLANIATYHGAKAVAPTPQSRRDTFQQPVRGQSQ